VRSERKLYRITFEVDVLYARWRYHDEIDSHMVAEDVADDKLAVLSVGPDGRPSRGCTVP